MRRGGGWGKIEAQDRWGLGGSESPYIADPRPRKSLGNKACEGGRDGGYRRGAVGLRRKAAREKRLPGSTQEGKEKW